jgi:outer membrane protein assembly factor BamB
MADRIPSRRRARVGETPFPELTWPSHDRGPWSGNPDFPDVELVPPLAAAWEHTITVSFIDGQCVGGGGRVALPANKHDVHFLDLATGALVWKRERVRYELNGVDVAGDCAFVVTTDPKAKPGEYQILGEIYDVPHRLTTFALSGGAPREHASTYIPMGTFHDAEGHPSLRIRDGVVRLDPLEIRPAPYAWGRVHRGVLYGFLGEPRTLGAHVLGEGRTLWRIADADTAHAVTDAVLVTRKPGPNNELRVRATDGGTLLWSFKPADTRLNVVVSGDRLFHVDDAVVVARDARTGEIAWRVKRNPITTRLVATRDHLWFGTGPLLADRTHHLEALHKDSGDVAWRGAMKASVTNLALVDESLVALVGRKVTCFSPGEAAPRAPARRRKTSNGSPPSQFAGLPVVPGLVSSAVAGQEIGDRNMRPYAMNAMTRPSTLTKMMGGISRYLTCTQMNTRLSIARTAAATTVSTGCQWRAAGTISPTRQTSSMTPRAIQAFRGNAPKDGTSELTLSNMKTFITPDAPYRNAASNCRTHNRTFMVSSSCFPRRRAGASVGAGLELHAEDRIELRELSPEGHTLTVLAPYSRGSAPRGQEVVTWSSSRSRC